MARISSYPFDTTVTDNDAWIGTESQNRLTKQFTASAVATYLNINAKVSVGGQMSFKWSDTQNGGVGTISKTGGGGSGTAFNTLSKKDVSGQNVVAFMDYIVGSHILISEQNEISAFGHFLIDSYTINNPDDDFYTLNLTSVGGAGNITELLYYDFAIFTPSSLINDKDFIFTQPTPSIEWIINHNMEKFPSVSVVNSNNILMYGNTTYIDKNNLKINFSAGFSGKAYLN